MLIEKINTIFLDCCANVMYIHIVLSNEHLSNKTGGRVYTLKK